MHVLPFEKYTKGCFKIAFLGDLMCENRVLSSVANTNPFKYIQQWLAGHDYTIGNLETTLNGFTRDFPRFSSSDLFADYLKGNLNAVFTANNHCYDYGLVGLKNTIDVLDDFGIEHIGTSKPGQIRRILDTDLENHEISFINYTQFINGKEEQPTIYQGSDLPEEAAKLINFYDKAAVKETIDLAKKKSQFVVLGIHQDTAEKVRTAGNEQRQLLEELYHEGVDVVLGSHPHYFQGGELKDDGRIIVYSLGNFFSSMYSEDYPINSGCVMVMRCDSYENVSYSFLPIATIKVEKTGDYFVIPLGPLESSNYSFIVGKQRNDLLEELTSIRKTLRLCGLCEEELPVQFF